MNEDTQEVPLPEGVARNPDATVTQELPVADPFPEVKLVSPVRVVLPQTRSVRVETVPVHLLGDPILTAPAPVADDTPLYDQIHGKPQRRAPKAPPRRMATGDKVLIGMGAAALVMGTGVYGMVVHGWGGGEPQADAKPSSAPVRVVESPEEPESPSPSPEATRRAPEPVKAVMAPETYAPVPERSIVVVSPTPTVEETEPEEQPEPTRTSAPPRPSHTPAPPPSPSVTPTPIPSSESPTPEESTSLSLPPSLSASSTIEESP